MMVPEDVATSDEATSLMEAWLTANVAGYQGPGRMMKFGFGQSNPTYRLSAASGDYVVRRKPFGPLLPKAHAIDREFRVLGALASSQVPVPKVLAFCGDAAVLGAEFYVMEFVHGRIFYDQSLPGLTRDQRAGLFDGMNDAVARLHAIDPAQAGLADFGRNSGFLGRQVHMWTRQYRAANGPPSSAMEDLIAWLPAHLPPDQPEAVFHGDLRLDNMIFHATEPRVIAILDWELSTIGDPLADFAYHAMAWRIGATLFRGYADLDRHALGIPEEQAYIRQYCERTGRTDLPHWNFYVAFSLFRLAAILRGIWRRAQDGQASAADAEEVGSRAGALAALAWSIASEARP